MALDPNWLYSATAQSAAAIVAILGGFITSRILALNSEKKGISNQLEEVEQRCKVVRTQEGEAHDMYETLKVQKFFDDMRSDFKDFQEIPPVEELLRRYPNRGLESTILQREYEKLSFQRLEARRFIEDNADSITTDLYITFQNWVNNSSLDISKYDYNTLHDEYNRFVEVERKILEEERKKNPWWQSSSVPSLFPSFDLLTAPSTRLANQLEKSKDRLDGLRYELQSIESEFERLQNQLRAFTLPPNLVWGFLSLLYLAIVGIVLPLWLLPTDNYSDFSKDLVLGLFTTGLFGVFLYILVQVRSLNK